MALFQNVTAKKSLGQHFLNNPHITEVMADTGHVTAGDVVVEVGPGTGVLTRTLLEKGATVIALEIDQRSIEALNETFKNEISDKKLSIIHGDVLEFDLAKLPKNYKVVSNIPYYISGKLFRLFLESTHHPSTLVFLVQKEVAERIVRDKKESILSISVKVFGEPKYVKTVGKGNFTPPPKIDSAVIAIENISHDNLDGVGLQHFFEIVHIGFASKRKQLLGNLSKKYDRGALVHIFSTLFLPEDVRGEDVPIEKWVSLAKKLKEL